MRQEVQLVGIRVLEIRCQRENQLQTEGLWPSGPPVEQPRKTRKKCCYSQKSWGSICCSFVQSPTHLSHITLSQPLRIKCERYIFLKNCVRSSLLCWLCFCMHMSMLHNKWSAYDTKLHPVLKLHFWNFEEYRTIPSLPLLPGSLRPDYGSNRYVSDMNTWHHITGCKSFILKLVTWSYNCLPRIIIINS